MIRKMMLSLLIFITATSAVEAAGSFNDRKANLTEVHALRVGYGSGTVRIVLDVTKPIEFTESYVEDPSRLILDLEDAWLNPNIQREIDLKSLAAQKVRIAQFNPSTVRIVVETSAATKLFNLVGGATGHRFVIDVGNAQFVENPDLNEPEPIKPSEPSEPSKPAGPTKPPVTEIPKDVEIVDADDLKKQQERELKEQQEREKKERELKEQREREKKERELKEQREREKKERELKEQREREKKERELKEKQEREKKERELKEQREREKKERELKEQREREKKERELKEKQEREKKERELKEKQEREKKERELKEQREREKKDNDKMASDKYKDGKEPLSKLDTDLEKITALSGKIIVIDPGHGGNDSGAIGPTGVMEKNVTLKVALELRKLLEAEGATVVMTRESDVTVSYKGAKASDIEELSARCEVANRIGAEIFISIHADSFTRPEARGTTAYYYSKSTTGRGQRLADCIRRNLIEQLGTPSRGTQPCNFYVVRHTDMPATLIELGFISNKDEERLLDSADGVRRAAQGILDGIEDYFG